MLPAYLCSAIDMRARCKAIGVARTERAEAGGPDVEMRRDWL